MSPAHAPPISQRLGPGRHQGREDQRPIPKLQCDNGAEFPFAFSLPVQEAGMKHRYITPRCPQQNGKAEKLAAVASASPSPTVAAATTAG
jgi:hypothetical protein